MFVPDWRAGNPYQELLAAALRQQGCRVTFPKDRRWKHHIFRMPFTPDLDVLHLHWQHAYLVGESLARSVSSSLGFIVALSILRLRGIRLVWTVHNLVSHERRFRRLERMASGMVARLVHRILVHYPEAELIVKDEYRLSPSCEVMVAPHGSFVDVYASRGEDGALAPQQARPLRELVFLAFGQVRPYKRLEDLIEAFKGLEGEAFGLVIRGDAPDRGYAQMLQTLADGDERIVLHFGFVEDDLVAEIYEKADIVVVPQTDALTSGSLILAMSMSKPVVAAATPHARFLLSEALEGGVLYQPGSQMDLHRALSEMVRRRSELVQMGLANESRMDGFTWAHMAGIVAEAYRN